MRVDLEAQCLSLELPIEPKMLIRPVATHWNSLTETIIRALDLQRALDMVVELAKYNKPGQRKLWEFLLGEDEWEILRQLMPLLDVSVLIIDHLD